MYFEARLPPLSFKNYFIVSDKNRVFGDVHIQLPKTNKDKNIFEASLPGINVELVTTPSSIENEILKVSFDETGIKSIKLKKEDKLHKISQSYWEYPSDSNWGNHYTFKPSGEPTKITFSKLSSDFRVIKTDLFEEFTFRAADLIWQTVRVFTSQSFVEVVETVGPPRRSTDIVSRYQTEWDLENKFYTDDSGLEMVQRTFNTSQQLSGNYFPTVYSCFIREHKKNTEYPNQLSYIMDTPHGVTSSQPGNLEIMIHRNNVQSLANGEPLNDNTVATVRSWLLLQPKDNSKRQQYSMKLNFPLIGVTSNDNINLDSIHKFSNDGLSFLKQSFPDDIFLTSFERYFNGKPKTIATRVNHLRQSDGVDYYDKLALESKPNAEIPLQLFNGPSLKVSNVEERMLSLNKSPEECKRNHWHHIDEAPHTAKLGSLVAVPNYLTHSVGNTSTISLSPMSIRSFFINFD